MSIQISVFHASKEDRVAQVDEVIKVDWNELPLLVTRFAWAPGTFRNNHRAISDFEQMKLFVCDIDGGLSIEDAKKIFAPYRCIIGTSRSHQIEKVKKSGARTPPCDRFRIILELNEPINNDLDFKATWFQLLKICPQMDPACKDSSRFYWPCQEIVGRWDGQTLSVTRYVEKERPVEPGYSGEKSGAKLTPSKRTLKFIAMGAPDGQWHGELVAACMDLKQQLWAQKDAVTALQKVTGHLDEHDEGVIEDVWNNRAPRHPARSDNSEAVRNLIMRCHLIQDLSPRRETLFLDRATGQTYDIDPFIAAKSLGAKQWSDYLGMNKLECFYTYNPSLGPLTPGPEGVLIYNTYRPPTWRHEQFWFGKPIPKVTEIPEVFDRFFTHLTDGHQESKEYLLDWMTNSLRARNFTVLTAIGNQGVGKGILSEILRNLHGSTNYCQPKDDVFKERFNGQLKNKTIVNVDEISLTAKEEHDRLKAVVNDWIDIEEKGRDAINCRNYANFYISSNHLDAIQIEPGDRRYSIIQLSQKKIIETNLRNNISYLVNPAHVGELGAYLLNRTITHDMLTPFRSPRFEEVRLAGLQDWELYIIEEFALLNAGKTHPVKYVLDEVKAALELRSLGRRRLIELSKKFPDRLKVFQDTVNRGIRKVTFFNPVDGGGNKTVAH